MDDRQLEDLVAIAPPLLQTLDRLGFVARYLHPPTFLDLLDACGSPDADLVAEVGRLEAWPKTLADVRDALATAAREAIAAFTELRAAPDAEDGLTAVFRALRHLPRAQEALYPLARGLPPVSRYFLEPAWRDDSALLQRLAEAPVRDDTGVVHVQNAADQRGGYSLYVPETYDGAQALPLVFALHGGSGHGRAFLWSWLRDARALGAILVAPTSTGRTWALSGPDHDSPSLRAILEHIRDGWNVDDRRLLLTGMSDGGTFSYATGLEPSSPFTHLAPVAAAFHPMMAAYADRDRINGLPIHIAHGALDWMFEVGMARQARLALERAGAAVAYREIADLSHTYPREINAEILGWMADGLA